MATLGEFGSLLQLGAGIGIGLSVFRAPFDLRSNGLARTIDRERVILKGVNTPQAKEKLSDLSSIYVMYVEKRERLERMQKPLLVVTVVAALGNLAGLIWSSLCASHVLCNMEEIALIFISVGSYVILLVILEFMARWTFGEVESRLRSR